MTFVLKALNQPQRGMSAAERSISVMVNIHVRRYPQPELVGGWQGWVEDADRTWIIFIDRNNKPHFFPRRDSTGAVLDPMPVNV